MRIENVFRALTEGKIVKCGNIFFRVSPQHELESRHVGGNWSTITELLNRVDWIGTAEEFEQEDWKEQSAQEE